MTAEHAPHDLAAAVARLRDGKVQLARGMLALRRNDDVAASFHLLNCQQRLTEVEAALADRIPVRPLALAGDRAGRCESR